MCSTHQRALDLNDNVVFFYDPANQFTPHDPFPSICDITHLWYRLVAAENGWHYFDFVGVLCKMVSSTVAPLMYLLYSPPTAVLPAPIGQQQTQPQAISTASLMGSAQATLQSQQDGQSSSTTAASGQASVVAAANAYTRSCGLAQTPAQLQPLPPATPTVSP